MYSWGYSITRAMRSRAQSDLGVCDACVFWKTANRLLTGPIFLRNISTRVTAQST